MANVIREDVVQVSFDIDKSGLNSISNEINKLKTSITGGLEDSINNVKKAFNGIKGDSGISKATKDVENLKKSVDDLGNSAGKISRFTQTFQSVNRTIQDGGAILAKFKNTITSLPHNAVAKISNGFQQLKLNVGTAAGAIKGLAKNKLSNLKSDISAVKTALTGGETGAKGFRNALANIGKVSVTKAANGISTIKDKLSQGKQHIGEFASKLKGIGSTSLSKLKSGLSSVASKLTEIGKKAATTAFNGLKKVASISFKGLAVGLGAAATAVGAVVTKAVSAFGENEQQIGGVKTLFGTKELSIQEYAQSVGKSVAEVKTKYQQLQDAENTVFKNANNAYKTAGLSANEYMQTVTTFSASLLQGLNGDTQKAAEKADIAITDMAD